MTAPTATRPAPYFKHLKRPPIVLTAADHLLIAAKVAHIAEATAVAYDATTTAIALIVQGIADTQGTDPTRPRVNRESKVLLKALYRAIAALEPADAALVAAQERGQQHPSLNHLQHLG